MVNHSNPQWTQGETNLLLEHYQTKEMYELQEILAGYYFPRPPEGIKRRLEKLSEVGIEIDKEKLEHLRNRKLWLKRDYENFKDHMCVWRKNNPNYFKMWFKEHPGYLKMWFKEHPDYLKKWLDEHKGYSKIAKQRFLEKHPNYCSNYKHYITKILPSVLNQALSGKDELSLQELSGAISNLSGRFIKESTLERILSKYKK